MKKFTILFLILLCLLFNIMIIAPLAQISGIKEGLYKASDLKLTSNKTYQMQNLSSNDSVFVLILDENNVVQQSFRLETKSPKYSLFPLKPDDKILIVGNGDVSISET
ncbi:hypothetical protein [Clostridium sp.]|uniref:hypothetical protein n=1 Tax=Clostridium sp. TaxID=1506 RepID=UPI00283D582E|nr:hypothetical protein [Clostridium sp.]MDR3594593.1 hypothetical protein [Clostridium sp.]